MVDDRLDETVVDNALNLMLIAGGDVRQEPDGLLAGLIASLLQQRLELVQRTAVQHGLRLLVGAGHDVAQSSQRTGLHLRVRMAEQRHQVRHKAVVDHHLRDLRAYVGEVIDRPDGVHEHVLVLEGD